MTLVVGYVGRSSRSRANGVNFSVSGCCLAHPAELIYYGRATLCPARPLHIGRTSVYQSNWSMPEPSTKKFSGIFVSYRRDDSSGHAGRLFDKLVDHFGRDRIFMDIDTIEPGEDFVTVIENAVGSCEVLIAIIGRYWLSSASDSSRRLDNPNDFVRLEIATALDRGIHIIPVLVQGAAMPQLGELPDELSKLSRRSALDLSDTRWQRDVNELITVLERSFARREEIQRSKAEEAEERRRKEADARRQEDEARRRQEDEARRRQLEAFKHQEEEAHRLREKERRRRQEEEARRRIVDERRNREEREQDRLKQVERVEKQAKDLEERLALLASSIASKTTAVAGFNEKREIMFVSLASLSVIVTALITMFLFGSSSRKVQPTSLPKSFTNRLGIEMVYIPSGGFTMGSDKGGSDEKPVHEVTISYSFYMGRYEVTQGQWQAVMGSNPSHFKDCGANCPVEQVSWNDAQDFINKLNEPNDGYKYRLPSEAELEYACRAGTTGDYAGDLDSMAWYGNNSGNSRLDADAIVRDDRSNYKKRVTDNGNKTHPVGTKQPNAWGLYDMHGNVQEWCQDWYRVNYNGAPVDGSTWDSGGAQGLIATSSGRAHMRLRVQRGGSWYSPTLFASTLFAGSAHRNFSPPDIRGSDSGFRVAVR